MTGEAARDELAPWAQPAPCAPPLPEDLEKLRLRFELELLQSQNAGASLDPLLRPSRNASGVSWSDRDALQSEATPS